MAWIEIDGQRYRVEESLGFQHSMGVYAKRVRTEDGFKMAVKHPGGLWRFWTTEDRTRPLREAIARGWKPGARRVARGQQ